MGGPDADSFDAHKVLDHGGVVKIGQSLKDDAASFRVLCQFPDIKGLLPREPQFAHSLRSEFHDSGGSYPFLASGGVQAGKNHTGYPATELLIDNGSNKGFESRLTVLKLEWTDALDDRGDHRVRFFEML